MRKTRHRFIGIGLVLIGLLIVHAGALGQLPLDKQKTSLNNETLRDKVAAAYTSQIGVRELTNRNDGAEVAMYMATTGFNNQVSITKNGKGYAWCAAFVTWAFKEATKGLDNSIATPANPWAPAWFPSSHVIYKKGHPLKIKPTKADVLGIWYGGEKRIGHVGFIDYWPDEGAYVISVEGNTNAAGAREGDGVYRKRRLKSNIYRVSRWI